MAFYCYYLSCYKKTKIVGTGNHLIHDRRYRHASRRFVKTWPLTSGAVLLAYLQQTHELIGEYPMSFGCLMRIDNNIIL